MSFSNVSVFRSAYNTLNTTASKAVPDSINKGGSFSPNTFESVALMRSELDNQWENGYIIKYQALMQNRLNRLRQDLTNAYKALLELSTVQQIRENGLDSSSAITDVYGRIIPDVSGTATLAGLNLNGLNSRFISEIKVGDVVKVLSTGQYVRISSVSNDLTATIANATYDENGTQIGGAGTVIPFSGSKLVNISSHGSFKGLTYFGDQTDFDIADGFGDYYTNGGPAGTYVDGIPSYWVNDSSLAQYNDGTLLSTKSGRYEMRKLYVAGPAMQVINTMKTTFRTEEVPPKETENFLPIVPEPDPPAFQAGTKVAEYSAEVKTGGFWSAVNYLYNFSPRELKYSYATAYSTTTEEAGTRNNTGGTQATLFNRQITDARDMQGQKTTAGTVGMNESDPAAAGSLDAKDYKPEGGSRIKWVSSNASDGYLTEKSAMFDDEDFDNDYQAGRYITRRTVATESAALFPNLTTLFDEFNTTVKDTWLWSPDGSKQVQYGTEEAGVGDYLDRIKWESQHDGTNAADIGSSKGGANKDLWEGGRDTNVTSADKHVAKAGYVNHYTVAVQDVELNSSNKSYGIVKALAYDEADPTKQKLLRSNGIDGSAEHVWSDEDGDKVVDDNSDEKLLLAGSGKISKNFDGKFVERLHQISSFNGQNIATNTANVSINTQNDGSSPVVMAEYEGFRRADTMTKGLAEDYLSQFNSGSRTLSEAQALAKKAATEINAIKMVDTDWHYSDYVYSNATQESAKDQDSVMFRNVKSISYSDNGKIGQLFVDYNPDLRNTNGTGSDKSDDLFKDANVAFRKSFTLTSDDFQSTDFNHIVGITSPPSAIDKRDVFDNADPSYNRKPVYVTVSANGIVNGTFDLVVNGVKVQGATSMSGSPASYNVDISRYLKEGDNVIGAQMTIGTGAPFDGFKLVATAPTTGGNTPEVQRWIDAKLSTVRRNTGDKYSEELNNPLLSNYLSSWQSKIQVERQTHQLYLSQNNFREPQAGTISLAGTTVTGIGTRFTSTLKPGDWVRVGANNESPGTLVFVTEVIDDNNFRIGNSTGLSPYQAFPPAAFAGQNFQLVNKAMDAYQSGLDSFSSERTVTRVKDNNSFAKILADILNKKEYQDVFALGLLNTAAGKTLTIKAQVSSPVGGNLSATIDIQYDARNNKFVLAQTKLDALNS